MAFNIVDKMEKHRGIILGRLIIEPDIIKTGRSVTWLCGLTDYRLEDFNYRLEEMKKVWIERWRLGGEFGNYDQKKFNERMNKMIRVHKLENLNNEEKFRFMHTWHYWNTLRDELESKMPIIGYVLISPFNSIFKDNKIIVDLPEKFPEPKSTEHGNPLFITINGTPKLTVETVYHDNVKIPQYSTEFKAISGNLDFEVVLPFLINNMREGDTVQLYISKGDIRMAYVNGLLYELVYRGWSLFN